MGVLVTVITIFLVILAIVIVLLILLQSDKSAGMGILGGGGSQSAFGSSTADVLTKMTGTMVAIFMISAFALSVIEARRPKSVVDTLPQDQQSEQPKVQSKQNLDEKSEEKAKELDPKNKTEQKDIKVNKQNTGKQETKTPQK